MSYYKFSIKKLVVTVIGASIFFLLARFLTYPIPMFGGIFLDLQLNLQYAFVGFFAAVFGPVCGVLVGSIGHIFVYLSSGDSILWSSVIASAFVGFLSGFLLKPGKVEEGDFDCMDVARFVAGSLVVQAISWGIVKPVGDILFYSKTAGEVFAPGLITGAGNFVITAIVGTLLVYSYSRTREKSIEQT